MPVSNFTRSRGLFLALVIATFPDPALPQPQNNKELALITGRVLEACSCSVPCPCNFGGRPSPRDFCESLAVFQIQSGELNAAPLQGLRFAIAGRAGKSAVLYLDSKLSLQQQRAARKIATWILSLEETPLIPVLTAPVNVNFGESLLSASISGTEVNMKVRLLKGNDGHSPITVSHPWIFGSFPIKSSRKGVTEELDVRAPSLSFTYAATNANDAVFEFDASEVR